jgi:hypothetical protein
VRALPRPPSTRLGCHALYILYHLFIGLTLVLLGTVLPLLFVHTVFHRVYSSFLVKLFVLVKLNKRGGMASVYQGVVGK